MYYKITSVSVLCNLLLTFLITFDLIPVLLGSSGHIPGYKQWMMYLYSFGMACECRQDHTTKFS